MNNNDKNDTVTIRIIRVNTVNDFSIVLVQLVNGEINNLLTFEEKETQKKWKMIGGPSFSSISAWERGTRSIILRAENSLSKGSELHPGMILTSANLPINKD